MSETFQEYSARLMALSAGKDGLAVLASTASRIGALLAGRSQAALKWTPTPGRWSIAEIVAHLGDAEIVAAYRMRATLASPGIALQAYDQNEWMRVQRHESSDPHVSLAFFAGLRAAQVRLLRGLGDEELERFGMHAERGKESLRYLIRLHAGHDLNHLGQIERLLAERHPADAPQPFTPAPPKPQIDQAALEKLDVRVGTIRAAEAVAGADRLALLTVDFGDRQRSVVAGIRTERASLDAVVGAQALFVVNLAPKTIRGQVSEGMLFDAGFADGLRPAFAQPEWPVPDGVRAG